ncbi:thiamine phosphate synthase [Micropruina sonneratiae]|uniref:thiamine phosphate synthase n=1 Tax=Micropruina sonneratiae TaxID=2986940 RepID=UPI002225E389|nr:thiamine phosphate synthase [Micropruina sp. KQZ13P-5]MCW3159367.1 thiamine phosphate synthase [Micropruina sp. KQZ13P-5]
MRFDPRLLAVYLVTDHAQCAAAGRSVAATVAAAVGAGVRAVQVRAKDSRGAGFLDEVLAVADAVAGVPGGEQVALFVNDRVDVALAAHAAGVRLAGVHVGQDDLPAAVVRGLLWPGALLGVSVSTAEQTRAAEPHADYIGIGPFRDTATKPDAAAALAAGGVAALTVATTVPAVTIGGVAVADLPLLRTLGLVGVAVVSGICAAPDAAAAARAYVSGWTSGSEAA